jgi:dCMP deaminase
MPLDKWDRRFIALAEHVSGWSKDPNAQVGAVITDARGVFVALGYNGFPKGVEDSAERLHNKDLKNQIVVHAEENAVLLGHARTAGGTIYVVGKPICNRCAGVIIQAGLKRVVAELPKLSTDSHWDEVGQVAIDMLREAGITIDSLSDQN